MIVELKQRAAGVLDHFFDKVSRVNKPLQALMQTAEYAKFEAALAKAIRKQAKWTREQIPTMINDGILTDDLLGMSIDQEAKLASYLGQYMPRLSSYMAQEDVSKFFRFAFVWQVKSQYQRWGVMLKAAEAVDFQLTNKYYIATLENQANYMLNKSGINETTLQRLVQIISNGKKDALTTDEVAKAITDDFKDISEKRAMVIARTETCMATMTGQQAAMKENGVQTKAWVTAGPHPCETCIANEDDGFINIDGNFSSGDANPPAHPNDECYTEAGEIDLESLTIWEGA